LVTGLLGGLLVMWFDRANGDPVPGDSHSAQCTESCCTDRGRRNIVLRVLEYGFITLPRDIGLALLVGVVIAGLIATFVQANQWQAYLGGGIFSIFLAMLVGVPLYVCASASVPIAAGLMHAGASPGAALAFLIAGPATNAATIATVWKVLGRRAALLYLVTIAASAVVGGLLLDWLFTSLQPTVPYVAEHCHEAVTGSWIATFWAVLLLATFAFSYAAKPRPEAGPLAEMDDDQVERESGRRLELSVVGMHCSHCADAVSRALRECSGVASVQVDLAAGRAVILGEPASVDELIAAVQSLGYRAEMAG
jgi:copper chaperone CopZ